MSKNKKKPWRIESRYDKTCNSFRPGMRFDTKREALEAAKSWRKELWWNSYRVVKND